MTEKNLFSRWRERERKKNQSSITITTGREKLDALL